MNNWGYWDWFSWKISRCTCFLCECQCFFLHFTDSNGYIQYHLTWCINKSEASPQCFSWIDNRILFSSCLLDKLKSIGNLDFTLKSMTGCLWYKGWYYEYISYTLTSGVDIMNSTCKIPLEKLFQNFTQVLFIWQELNYIPFLPPCQHFFHA